MAVALIALGVALGGSAVARHRPNHRGSDQGSQHRPLTTWATTRSLIFAVSKGSRTSRASGPPRTARACRTERQCRSDPGGRGGWRKQIREICGSTGALWATSRSTRSRARSPSRTTSVS